MTETSLPPPSAPAAPRSPLPGSVTAAAVLLLIFGALAGIGTAIMLLGTLSFAAIPMDQMMWGRSLNGLPPCYGVMAPDGSNSCDMGYGWFQWVGVASAAVMALLGAAAAGGHVAAGVGILQGRAWGRILGMVVSGTALIVVVLGFASIVMSAMLHLPPGFENVRYLGYDTYPLMMAATIAFGVVFGGLLIAAYGYILWVLAKRGDVFE